LPYYFDAPEAYAAGSIFNNLGFGFPVGNGTFNLQTLRFIEKKIDVDGKPKPEDAAFCAGFQIFKDFVYVYNPDFRYQNYIKSSFQNKTTRSASPRRCSKLKTSAQLEKASKSESQAVLRGCRRKSS
jgi:hypothetical protein